MCVVETMHFLAKWSERVGKYRPRRVRKSVLRAIQRGEHRLQWGAKRGILVPVKYRGEVFCVIGVPEEKREIEFVLKSVLTEDQARAMGWVR